MIASLLACGVVASNAATFWPERGDPLKPEEVERLAPTQNTVISQRVLTIDDMIFPADRLILSGFSADPWPSKALIYDITALSSEGQKAFEAACKVWAAVSNVRCAARTDQTGGYMKVVKIGGNVSSTSVGYPGLHRVSSMLLCCYNSVLHIAHELGHAFGLSHEQARSDRDTMVQIHFENVTPGEEPQFEKRRTTNFGLYDFRSIMHYHQYAFSKNGLFTIEVLPPNQAMQNVIGRYNRISDLDGQGMSERYREVQ
jgi:hypothetical protein